MIVWAKYAHPRARKYHAVDLRWRNQRHFRTLCWKYRHRLDLVAARVWSDDKIPRSLACKTCMRVRGYHLRRPRPV